MENDLIAELAGWQRSLAEAQATVSNMIRLAVVYEQADGAETELGAYKSLCDDLCDIVEDNEHRIKPTEAVLDAMIDMGRTQGMIK